MKSHGGVPLNSSWLDAMMKLFPWERTSTEGAEIRKPCETSSEFTVTAHAIRRSGAITL